MLRGGSQTGRGVALQARTVLGTVLREMLGSLFHHLLHVHSDVYIGILK